MLKLKVGGPRVLGGARRTYAIVASQYNPHFVQGLVDHAATELMRLVPNARLILHQVPGAFEIPLIVQELLSKPDNEIDAILALGVIIQGDTNHADLLGHSVTHALLQIMLAARIPVVHEVLTCKDETQAQIRCVEDLYNRGTEAAHTAINMSSLIGQLRE